MYYIDAQRDHDSSENLGSRLIKGVSYAVKYVTVTKLNTKLKERLKEI